MEMLSYGTGTLVYTGHGQYSVFVNVDCPFKVHDEYSTLLLLIFCNSRKLLKIPKVLSGSVFHVEGRN